MSIGGVRIEEINQEVVPLLSHDRADVRFQTLDFFFGLTGSNDNFTYFRDHALCLEAIAQLTKDLKNEISRLAYKTLVNLSADEEICKTLLKLEKPDDFIHTLIQYVLIQESEHADLVCSVLCNLTHWEGPALEVVEIIKSHEDIGFDKIVQILCTKDYNKNASLDLLALFLSNLSQIIGTRQYILDKEKCVIQRLLPFTGYQGSVIKRRGVVGTLRNCCFEADYHEWLLSDKVDILPCLLLPLAGPETFDDDDMDKLPPDLQYLDDDKTREPEAEIRKMLVEAIYQLCATKHGRKYMKDKNAYVIIRELDKWEEDRIVSIAIEKLVTILIGDEPERVHENLQNVVVPEHLQKQFDMESEDLMKEEKIPYPDSEVMLLN
ncbi:protein HGH1 homolog [Lineus longissimus]|uniref:protein HGH1 homolog n=1 Tax=Lineus longissimus TaxID=88925 RepID=UPI00315D888D